MTSPAKPGRATEGAARPPGGWCSIFIAGPTAVGKSALALAWAEEVGGEIISVDCMQVYRGMDIGTAKPSAAERARVPHHLIDVAELWERFDAARFTALAAEAREGILARGRTPVFCGGTGFYFKALAEGLGDAPPADPLLRRELAAVPLPVLLAELEAADPACFAVIDRANPRRVIRAVEVIRRTGRPYSEHKPAPASSTSDVLMVGLEMAPSMLQQRIDTRVEAMFAAGLVGEVKALLAEGLRENEVALQALGYRQIVNHLDGGPSLKETKELVKLRTRQFAKRQMTWFKGQPGCHWINVTETGADPLRSIRQLWGSARTVVGS